MEKKHLNPFRKSKDFDIKGKNGSSNFDNHQSLGKRVKSPSGFQASKHSKEFGIASEKNLQRHSSNNYNPDELNDKEKEWGKVKFNPIAATASEGMATPWLEFKRGMMQHAQEKKNKKRPYENSGNLSNHIKDGEKQLNKKRIFEKQNLPTPQWEDFGILGESSKSKKGKRSKAEDKKSLESKTALISEECLRNFDSKKLSFAQKNKLRKVITKTTISISAEGSLSKSMKGLEKRNDRYRKR